jgi:murein DD-endopeptidase MepM/ murein hydrolase activator NlpD
LEVDLKEKILDAATDLDGLHEFRLVINNPSGGTDIIFEGTLITAGVGHPYNTPPVYAPPDFDPAVLLPFLMDITHNPFELMAYLTAEYGDFTGHDIKAILEEIFNAAFNLEIIESFEVKTATVECWYYELQDLGGMQDLGGFVDGVWVSNWQWVSDWQNVRVEPYTETMNYNWYYREVVLTINSTVSAVIQDRLDDENQEQYFYLMESLGLRQFVSSPFENDWLGSVSSTYGYRFHPITKAREMHNGIDIAMPEGTPILSGLPGTVTFAGEMSGYGNTVIIEYVDAATGKGVKILYAHLKDINVAVGDTPEIGESIGTVGDTGTATGFHLHMEVSINESGGTWKHINPLFFVEPYVAE